MDTRAGASGRSARPHTRCTSHVPSSGNAIVKTPAIARLPLQDASVDCIISNCVINLAPDKGAVFREMHRVLKPGGRVAVSDIALKQPLPEELGRDILAYVGCIAGAIHRGHSLARTACPLMPVRKSHAPNYVPARQRVVGKQR